MKICSTSLVIQFSAVQLLSRVQLFATPWIAPRQASLSITISRSSFKLTSIESVMPSSHLILCRPFSSCPQSLPASESFPMTQLFAWGGQSTGVTASASFLLKNTQDWSPLECTGWISLQSKGLSSLLQHHSSKPSILRCSAFFTVQLSHSYVTTGKTLTRRTLVSKVMSLLLNMLCRLVTAFLPRSKRLLVSWLQSPSAVILEPKKIKFDTVSTLSPSISANLFFKSLKKKSKVMLKVRSYFIIGNSSDHWNTGK